MWLPTVTVALGSICLWKDGGGTALDFIPGDMTASKEPRVG